jgi:CubicO group peptidase (beta-lactamase class C family)
MIDLPRLPTIPLPAQPADVPWPTEVWPSGEAPAEVDVDGLLAELFDNPDQFGDTYAAIVIQHGRLLAERYGGELVHFDRDAEPVEVTTRLLSWSMAKSMVHAAIGILVGEGRLDVDAPAPIAAWHEQPDDARASITVQQMLEMRDGLAFQEAYTLDAPSDVVAMLFGDGKDDMVAYAAARPIAHDPGTHFNYSSGTSVLLSRVIGDVVGGGEDGMRAFLHGSLFDRIGMRSVDPRFDPAGTFIGSSYVYAPAQDFARFGLLYLRDGVWDGERILPEGWVDHGRTVRSYDAEDDRYYGAHWWAAGDDLETFFANGYEGQSIMCVPALDLLVVRLGKTPEALKDNWSAWRLRVRDAFRVTAST